MNQQKWDAEWTWYLLTLPPKEWSTVWPENTYESLRVRRRNLKRDINAGSKQMPEQPPDYRPEETPEELSARLHDPERLNKISELLGRAGVDPDTIQHLKRVNIYQMGYKDADGEAQTKDLVSVSYVPVEEGVDLESLFISQAAPTTIRPTARRKPTRTDSLTLAMGDSQIGFRGSEPFHDERSMELAQVAVRELQPDNIVLTGDMIDLPAMSRFSQRHEWQQTTQAAIDRYHSFLAQLRANAPDANIVVVHGNHELRMDTFLQRDAAALLGIRRANAENELSVLTLQYLVRYADLEVKSIDGYPNAAYWLEDNIKVTHGTNTAKGGSNAAKYLREEDTTTIYGHTHRMELAYKTIATRLGQRIIAAASPGCLARTDGHVPGFHYSVDNQGQTVPKAEDWQQGLLIIEHNPRVHNITPVRFTEDGMRLFGKHYE
jgi:predicted MPP superfamily phosphohydrolase